MRVVGVMCGAVLALGALASAQPPGRPQFDPAAVARGRELLVERCGFCHGSNARGGAGGSDLTRSPVVQEDEGGRQLGEFLKLGRPERNMPAFPDLTDGQLKDLAEFLHEAIQAASDRGAYKILDIVVGDAKAGAAYFAANCGSCHSATGDLKGVGARYDPATLQGRMLMPRGGRRGGPAGRPAPYMEPTAIKAKVTLPGGEAITGALVGVTDFQVVIHDPQAGRLRSWLRHDGVPAVELTDPLQAHIDMWKKWTDTDMHDVTAYLVTLK